MITLEKIFPKKKFERVLLWCILAFCAALAIDLITKGLAEYYLDETDLIPLIPGFMNLTLVYNSGMAFSLFNDNPVAMGIITWGSLLVMLAFVYIVYRLPAHYNICRVLLSVVTAGAFGNFLDRVLIEDGVRDFMDVSSINFGVCNFADYFVSIGGVILAATLIWKIMTDKEEQ
jgi:signal peptidase II